MSENAKKPGARDISDLKARLGLKKGADGARPGTQGVVPPPTAAKIGGYVPPPPGAGPQQPAAPAIPDARVDPFGAMNAMAAHAAPHAAPQYVIVDDGKPVESIQAKGKTGWVKLGLMVVVPLILGFVVGGISYKNSDYNATIDDARMLTDELRGAGKPLQGIYEALLAAKERGPDKASFTVGDKELTEQLETLSPTPPDPVKLFNSRLTNLDPKLVEDTIRFYGDVAMLYDKVKVHIRLTTGDAKKTFGEGPFRKIGMMGAIIRVSKDNDKAPPMVQLVQLGAPVCADGKPNPGGCGSVEPIGFQFRPDQTSGAWGNKLTAKAGELSADTIFPLEGTPILEEAYKGGDRMYSELAYMARVKEIEELTNALVERRKSIENRLNGKAQESKRFSL